MRFIICVLLGYLTLGVLFAILAFLGLPRVTESISLSERLKISVSAVIMWPYAVKEGIRDLIDYLEDNLHSPK